MQMILRRQKILLKNIPIKVKFIPQKFKK